MTDETRGLIGLDLSVASKEVIEVLIEDAADAGIFGEIARANTGRPEILHLLSEHHATPDEVRAYVAGILQVPVKSSHEIQKTDDHERVRGQSILQRIQSLTVGERIQLAMKGGREIRGILIKDTNKEVMLSVLENQKITETEIEAIARSRSMPEEALRRITKNREWMKNYAICLALVSNPKTPPGIAVTLVTGLKMKDLVILENNKNVPELVRTAAKRLLAVRKKN
ncbi:MAG: hypothetical protein OHK006_20270 [Thermodesulfovibrionales bacterium]